MKIRVYVDLCRFLEKYDLFYSFIRIICQIKEIVIILCYYHSYIDFLYLLQIFPGSFFMNADVQTNAVFHVFHSNSLDDLAELTSKLLDLNTPESPFDTVSFIVPNAGMKNWLDIRLAEHRKISMQNSYDFPWSFVWKLFSNLGLVEESRPQERYRMDTMIWTIYTVLGNILDSGDINLKKAFSSIYDYVYSKNSDEAGGTEKQSGSSHIFTWENSPRIIKNPGERDETKLYQLSQSIAEIFDRYIIYRSDWLQNSSRSEVDYAAEFGRYEPKDDQKNIPESISQTRSALNLLWSGITADDFRKLPYRQQLLIRNNIWQVILWRRVVQHNSGLGSQKLLSGDEIREGHIANMIEVFAGRIDTDAEMQKKLPPSVFVFGISSLEPLFFRLLKIMSRYVKVFYLNFNPCRHYWGDIRYSGSRQDGILDEIYSRLKELSRKVWDRKNSAFLPDSKNVVFTGNMIMERDDGGEFIDEKEYTGNRLLASWGRQGSDNLYMLVENMTADSEVFEESSGQGVLQLLQHLVLNDTELSPFKIALSPEKNEAFNEEDCSFIYEDLKHNLEIHSCYSQLREIEAIYDRVLKLFDSDKTLKPNDLVIMAPNISAYAPFIDAVFGKKQFEYERNIPYVISDQTYEEMSTFLNSVFDLLNLPWCRINGSLVIKLLDSEQICSRFGFESSDVSLIESWIMNASIKGDYSEEDLYSDGDLKESVPVYSTWRRAIPRIVAGSVMPENSGCWLGRIQLYSEIRGQNIETFASLCRFVEALEDLRSLLSGYTGSGGLTSGEWLAFVNENLLEPFFDENQEISEEIMALNEMIMELKDKFDNIDTEKRISLEVFVSYLRSAAGSRGSFRPFMSGKVNFCTFVPMRSIPFRYIFMIGLNSNDFPRRDLAYDFDLMRRSNGQFARLGDRSSRNDDRYMFLETIMSARDGVYISYIGRSIVNNSELNPSVLVTELLGFLADNLAVREIYEKFKKERETLENGTSDILETGPKLNALLKENRSALTDPRAGRLVFVDRMHIWDPENFVMESAGQSYQREWYPVSEDGNALGFYTEYLTQCIDLMNIDVSGTFLCQNDAKAKTVINRILEHVYHSCFNFTVADGRHKRTRLPAVTAENVMRNKRTRYSRGYGKMLYDLQNVPGDDRSSKLEKRRIVTDQMPLIVLDTLLSALPEDESGRYVLDADVYGIGNQIGTVVTDAGIFSPDCSTYRDENNGRRKDIPAGSRTLTLRIRDLTEFMEDPVNAMYRKRFTVKKEDDDRFLEGINDVEPMDVSDVSAYGFSMQQKIADFCLRFIEERCDIEWNSDNLDDIYLKLLKPGDDANRLSVQNFFDELKYGGYLPNGRDAVDGNSVHYEASSLLKTECSANFKNGFRRNCVLSENNLITRNENGVRTLNRADAVSVHYEMKLCGDLLPEPYRSVFPDDDNCFTVIIEDVIDDMYRNRTDEVFHVIINDIHNSERQKKLFLLNCILLSIMKQQKSSVPDNLTSAKFFDLKGNAKTNSCLNLRFLSDDVPSWSEFVDWGKFYLRELVICYLRGMNEPLVLFKDLFRDDPLFELPDQPPCSGIMSALCPSVEEFLRRNEGGMDKTEDLSAELEYIFEEEQEVYLGDLEKNNQCPTICKKLKSIDLSGSDYFSTDKPSYNAEKLSVRKRMLFQNVEDIPIKRTLALFLIFGELLNLIFETVPEDADIEKDVAAKTSASEQKKSSAKKRAGSTS